MTVCQAPALLGRPAGVRCARRRLGLRWRACRWAVSRLVLAGAWWPVAGQRPGLRLQQVTGADGAATWAAVLAGGWAGPVTVSRAARTAGRSAASRAAGPVFYRWVASGAKLGSRQDAQPRELRTSANRRSRPGRAPGRTCASPETYWVPADLWGRGFEYRRERTCRQSRNQGKTASAPKTNVGIHARRCRAGRRPGTGVGVLVIGEGRNTGMRARAGTRLAAILIAGGAFLAVPATSALASATHGKMFFNGQVVGTMVTPAAVPGGGTDPFYEVSGGVAGQLGIAGDGPSSPDYRGGLWAVNVVTFTPGTTPFLLTSAQAVLTAQSRGQVTVTRDPAADFRCPLQL